MSRFIKQIYRKRSPLSKKIIFLDRDGTINKEGYIRTKKDLRLLPKVSDGIRLLNKNNIIVVVITNQPAVARGHITASQLIEINDHLVYLLNKEKAYIDAIYSCPHHPEGEISKYGIKCRCRKPGILMFSKALAEYNKASLLGVIGDQTRDVLAGKRLKTKTLIVKTGYGGMDGLYDVLPDFTASDFLAAVKKLL